MNPSILDIENFCNQILHPEKFTDETFNGTQIETARPIKKIVSSVSISKKLIEQAIKKKADLILLHHGFKFGEELFTLRSYHWQRAKLLIENQIGIIVYHLPLDAHPQIGNNISLAKIIRLKNLKPFSVGFIGELPKATNTAKIAEIFKKAGINPERFTKNRKEIRKVAIVSGNASGNLSDWNLPFDKLPFDLFLTGEFHEHKAVLGEERNYDFMALGHDASETLGIQNLGNKIAKKFGIVHEFINI